VGFYYPTHLILGELTRVEAIVEQRIDEPGLRAWFGAEGLNVRWPTGFNAQELVIFDAAGRLVASHRMDSTADRTAIDVALLPDGLYLIRVRGREHWLGVKLVKEEGGF
jgi:hypothetical protein